MLWRCKKNGLGLCDSATGGVPESHIPSPLTLDGLIDCDHVVEIEKIDVSSLPSRKAYHVSKRVFDVLSCGGALVALSPLMLGVAIAVKLDSPGPVIYRQVRLGKNGVPFVMHKFRSMYVDAELNGPQWADAHDTRITRVGRFLRQSKLDEIPQFWDVLRGKMSLVGPRPERAVFYDEFEKYIHGFSQRLLVTPGLTGYAQAMGGLSLKPAEKILYDIEYIKQQSAVLDLRIILRTLHMFAVSRKDL